MITFSFNHLDGCCSTIVLSGTGAARANHLDKLGKYESTNKTSNGRMTFKLKGKEYFLHWSPEDSWMVIRTICLNSLFVSIISCRS